MCLDYRLVNKKLIADKYPLPRIDEILDGLGRAIYFSILDLFNEFYQIPLEEESRDITSFSTPAGSFRWKVLPFGLNVSPNSFSRMMSLAFAGANQIQYFLYMDDVIVIRNSVKHHLKNLQGIFDICRKRNLKLNSLKCRFFRTEVTYLGYKSTANGIQPDPEKLPDPDYLKPDPKIKKIRTDHGTEYLSNDFKNFCKRHGIQHQTSYTYTPQQNGKAERFNRSIIEKAKCLLFDANLPKVYWAQATRKILW